MGAIAAAVIIALIIVGVVKASRAIDRLERDIDKAYRDAERGRE